MTHENVTTRTYAHVVVAKSYDDSDASRLASLIMVSGPKYPFFISKLCFA